MDNQFIIFYYETDQNGNPICDPDILCDCYNGLKNSFASSKINIYLLPNWIKGHVKIKNEEDMIRVIKSMFKDKEQAFRVFEKIVDEWE